MELHSAGLVQGPSRRYEANYIPERALSLSLNQPPIGQVTCLKFCGEKYILYGAGPYLCVCFVEDAAAETSRMHIKVFDDHTRIHKIQIIDSNPGAENSLDLPLLLLTGGKRLALLSFSRHALSSFKDINTGIEGNNYLESLFDFKELYQLQFSDWIRDVKLVQTLHSSPTAKYHAAVLFSQNFAQLWCLDRNELVYSIVCSVRCMLYSGTIFGKEWESLTFVSGTIFNQALFWNTRLQKVDDLGHVLVDKRLIGHEGVLFGIEFNENGTKVCTVSDDRSIRVWNIQNSENHHVSLKGHEGRVWGARFVSENLIISISEDSTCRVWDLSTTSCIACWDGHGGKHVWGFDFSLNSSLVATGGGDGGIRLWSMKDLNYNPLSSLNESLVLPMAPMEKKAKYVLLLDDCRVAILGCQGNVTVYDWEKKESNILMSDPDLIGYGKLLVSKDSKLLVTADGKGNLSLVSPQSIFKTYKWKEANGKLFSLFLLDGASDNTYNLFGVTTAAKSTLFWYKISLTDTGVVVDKLTHTSLPKDVINICDLAYLEKDGLMAFGSRNGALCVYSLEKDKVFTLCAHYRKLHGPDAITSIIISKESDSSWEISTSGRDGYYVNLLLEKNEFRSIQPHLNFFLPPWKLHQTCRARHTKGYLEKIYQVQGTTLICGSFDFNLFVLNETKKYEMFSLATGGPATSRIWDFRSNSPTLAQFTIVFIKDGVAYLFRRATTENALVYNPKPLDSFHSQETRAVTFLPFLSLKDNYHILVSGGEDETLTFHLLDTLKLGDGLKKISSNRTHSASIRSLCFSFPPLLSQQLMPHSDCLYLFSAGSEQKLISWKTKPKFDSTGSVNGMYCVATATAPETSSVLENRIMDVSVAIDQNESFLIATANSDCFIRLWKFHEATADSIPYFEILTESSRHGRCVQRSRLVSACDGKIFLFTAATDGNLIMWNVTNDYHLEFIYTWKIHQSGIKAMSAATGADSSIIIVTGGDDNAVAFLLVNVENISSSLLLDYKSAHGSSVVGCEILSPTTFLSISIDQRVNYYSIVRNSVETSSVQLGEWKLVLDKTDMIDVADPSDISYSHEGRILVVVGHGIQTQVAVTFVSLSRDLA